MRGMDACILWPGPLVNGYPRYAIRKALWVAAHGPIPKDEQGKTLDLDHVCRVRACINITHWEPVTHAENMRRARVVRWNAKTCPKGHEYTPENTILRAPRKDHREVSIQRLCRQCHREGN